MNANDLSRISRGEVFYITPRSDTVGSEQKSGRPAVVVSNNVGNDYSPIVEVVYLTLQEKKPLPTHVLIDRGACANSIIMCEQITTISKERIGDYMCTLPDDIMDAVDKALIVSLGLDYIIEQENNKPVTSTPAYEVIPNSTLEELDKLRVEKNELEAKNKELSNVIDSLRDKADKASAYFKEAETYKALYDKLIDKIIGK